MDVTREDELGWVADGLASAVLGAAIGTCLLLLGQPGAGVAAASVAGLLALATLRRVKPEPRRFRMPDFVPVEAFAPATADDELLLAEIAMLEKEAEPLLLDDPLEQAAPDSRVVQLFAARPLPTPGELQQRIAAHLAAPARSADGGKVLDLEVDAAAALRQALGELRRNLA